MVFPTPSDFYESIDSQRPELTGNQLFFLITKKLFQANDCVVDCPVIDFLLGTPRLHPRSDPERPPLGLF